MTTSPSTTEDPRVPFDARRAGATVLRQQKDQIAELANSAFLERHPDWLVRYGDAAIRRGREDAAYQVEFLAGALETGEPRVFVEYVRWLLEMLGSRGIAADAVAESLALVGREVIPRLDDPLARASMEQMLQAGYDCTRAPLVPAEGPRPGPLAGSAALFLTALLQGERHGALGIAREALRVASDPTDVYVDIFQSALVEIGCMWQRREITVAQEHMATAIVQFVLAQLYSSIARGTSSRGSALVTGVEGELHQVGANLVADAWELDGWRVRFLGTNVPVPGILEAIRECRADVVGISATMIFNIDAVADLVTAIRGMTDRRRLILVGGGAFRNAPHMWKELGADGSALDVRGACSVARGELRAA